MINDVKTKVVYQTMDYSKFKPIDGNRIIDDNHIKSILQSMRNKLLFTVIIINELYQIIDGQHRFEALKILGFPINYCICEGYRLPEVHLLNQNSKNWQLRDYLYGYADNLGKEEYIKFFILSEKFNEFGINTLLELVNRKEKINYIAKKFKNGTYKNGDIAWAEKFLLSIKCFEEFFYGYYTKNFVKAFLKIYLSPKYNHQVMLKKLEQTGQTMMGCSKANQYLTVLTNIYNTRTKTKEQIHFSLKGEEI